jgi:hypothetical protein
VFWLWGCVASLVYTLAGVILDPHERAAIMAYTLAGVALTLLQSAMLWQCAYNSRSRWAGALTRAAVVLGMLMMPLILYVTFKYPDLFLP